MPSKARDWVKAGLQFRDRIDRSDSDWRFAWRDRKIVRRQMPKKSHVVSYWLLPEAAARQCFADKTNELAARFGAPLFAPHVTVFIGPENSRHPAEVLCEIGPITIELT